MATERTYLSAAQVIKVSDLIRRHESTIRAAEEPADKIIELANGLGIAVTHQNLKMLQKAMEINWIFPPKRKPANLEETAAQYAELCDVVDRMDERLQKIERAIAARGWAL